MDLNYTMVALVALGLGLVLGGCLGLGAYFVGICLLFTAYYVVNAFLNVSNALLDAINRLQKQDEPEDRHIGYDQNLIDIKENEE